MKRPVFIAVLLCAAAPGFALAQQVYRCGSAYSQQPCAGAVTVQVDDARTPAEAARATRVAQADAKRADAMEKARLAQEARAPKAVIPVVERKEPTVKPEPHAKKLHKGKKPSDYFTAVSPKPDEDGGGKKKKSKS